MRPLAVVPLLLLVACAGPEDDGVALDEDVAASLAQGAQRLAVFLEEQEGCDALAEADELAGRARDGVEAGTVPPEVANEVEAVVEEVTASVTCDPQATEDDAGEDDAAENDAAENDAAEDDADEGEGDGGGPGPDAPGNGPEGEGPPGRDGPDDDRGGSPPPDHAEASGRRDGAPTARRVRAGRG